MGRRQRIYGNCWKQETGENRIGTPVGPLSVRKVPGLATETSGKASEQKPDEAATRPLKLTISFASSKPGPKIFRNKNLDKKTDKNMYVCVDLEPGHVVKNSKN